MKKFSYLLTFILFISIFTFREPEAQVAVTGSVSVNGNYGTLSAAFNAINSVPQTGASVLLTITSGTSEPVSGAVLNNGAWTTLTIQPNGGTKIISGNITPGLPMIDLNGADNVIIDGLSANGLEIRNNTASSVSGTSTIRFQSDAVNNKIRNCRITGSADMGPTTNGGIIWFGGNSATTGNDNNVISNCDVGPLNNYYDLATKCFHFSGTTTTDNLNNSGDTVRNCNIFDYFSNTVSSAGIYIGPGTTNTIIKDNKFYKQLPGNADSTLQHSAIWISNTAGNNFLISGNTIGYSSSSGTGTYDLSGGVSFSFNAISIEVSNIAESNVQNNIIRNISVNAGTSPFKGIFVPNGRVNITGNSFGDQTGTGNLNFDAPNGDVIMINATGNGNINCSNNSIGGVTLNLSPSAYHNFYGILATMFGSATFTCENNIIGGTSGNSISALSTHSNSHCNGIYYSGNPISTITGNTIRNITAAGGTGTNSSASIIGIAVAVPANNHSLQQNLIYNLKNTNAADATTITGIYSKCPGGTNFITKNFIHNNMISSNNAVLIGILADSGTVTYQNNMISLGTDSSENSVTPGASIRGISETAGINNFYFNTIYIGGRPTTGSNNTFAFTSSVISNARIYRNNIFLNGRSNNGSAGKHYSVSVGGTAPNPAGLTLNNNIYLANGSGGVFGFFNSADVTSLTAWKTSVGQDAGSYQSDPRLINPGGATPVLNLHIDPSIGTIAEGNGFNIGSVTDDFDGQTRSTLTPVDIGADAGNFISVVKVTNALVGNGNYLTLSSAFAAINSGAQTSANILISIGANISEPSAGAVLNQGAWTSLTIQPVGTGRTISANVTPGLPLIDLNGADNVTIDGISISNNFTFNNTSTSSASETSTIRFQSDARNNKIRNCRIFGSAAMPQSTPGGTVFFGGNSLTTGNDNNVVSNCDIGSASPSINLPAKGVCMIGTTTSTSTNNSGDTIRNCNIYNYFSGTVSSAGVFLGAGTRDITVKDNKFYMDSSQTGGPFNNHSAIMVVNSSGSNYMISGNTIGSSSSSGSGTYSLNGGSNFSFYAILLIVNDTAASNVQNNIIKNISLTVSDGLNSFKGIFVSAGKVNITGNSFGDQTGTGNLSFTAPNSDLVMIEAQGNGSITCSNNIIGGIDINSSPAAPDYFYGMRVNLSGPAIFTCQNNIIGGTAGNSINNASSHINSICYGIVNTNNASIITGNTIRNITSANGTGFGIAVYAPSQNHTLSQNSIYNLKNTNVTDATAITGIYFQSSAGTNLVAGNFIHNNIISNNNGVLTGIQTVGGTATYQNNMISLGTDTSGNSVTTGVLIRGIYETSGGTNNFYFNTVYIGGRPATGTNNTFAFISNVTGNARNYRNNIFLNGRSNNGSTGKHYAVNVAGSAPNPAGLTINNNIYLANGSGGTFGLFNNSDVAALSAWQTAVGQDAGSFQSDPRLINPGGSTSLLNLHIDPSLVTMAEGNGFNIAGITDDFDGQTRSALTPVDIGADAGNFTGIINVTNALVGNGSYNTLSAAFAAINAAAQTSANILISISANITEPSTGAVLNNGAWNSLTIQPNGSGITISANVNPGLPLIDLNGADNVIINGSSLANNFTFSNSSASSSSGTSTVRLRNDAVNNKIMNCIIEGSSTVSFGSEGGVVSFSTSPAGVTGNDNNVVSGCRIKPAGSNLPVKGVSFLGTTGSAALNNSSDTIRNCDIQDYFHPTLQSAGVYIDAGNTDIGIVNNNFFQTAPRTQTFGVDHSAVKISNPSGNNFLVSENNIGQSASLADAAPAYSITGVAGSRFYGIYIAAGDSGVSKIQNNIVQDNIIENISFSGSLTGTGVNSPFAGIYASGGLTSLFRNTIGNMSSGSNIVLSSTSSSNTDMLGIFLTGEGLLNECNNNNIGGITISNSGTGQTVFYCIRVNSSVSTEVSIQSNIVGGTNANSINNTTNGSATRTFGIHSAGPRTLTSRNTVRNITSAGGTGTTNLASVTGVLINNTALSNVMYNNRIYNLKNTNTSASCQVNGIYFSGSDTGYNYVAGNFIHNLMISGNNSSINGIYVNAGATTFENNMISLGLDTSGSSMNYGIALNGIREFGGTNNFYFNSVYAGGSPTSGAGSTFAFNSSVITNPRNFRNNIFYNARSNSGSTGKHYSVRVGGTSPNPAGLTMSNNVYLVNGTGGVFGQFNGADIANLSAWQSATGQDANSFESDPDFINPNGSSSGVNLHINPASATVIEGNGIDVAPYGYDDFDGALRDTLTPVDIGADAGNFIPLTKTFNLTMFIQGFYDSGTNVMVQDTVRVYFRNGSSPYAIVDSTKAYMSSSGTGTFTVSNISNGVPYYIQLKHRNSLETWSDSAKTFAGNSLTFNFTTAGSKAYGSNMPAIDASPLRFGIYSGDVNQEGNVDLSDILLVNNDAGGFVTGYVKTDVNGDNITDLSDLIITYNNSADFVSVEKP